jgi:polyisoprenoid-binding protein YceI
MRRLLWLALAMLCFLPAFAGTKVFTPDTTHSVIGFRAGTLEMHGVKKDLTLAFEPAFGKNGAGVDTWSYEATFQLRRSDFGIGADSVAAKISLKDPVEVDLMLVGFFHDAK